MRRLQAAADKQTSRSSSVVSVRRSRTLRYGTMSTYLERYEKHAPPVQQRHLEWLPGFYVTEIGTLNQVVHLQGYDSLTDRELRRDRFAADPDWHEFCASTPAASSIRR